MLTAAIVFLVIERIVSCTIAYKMYYAHEKEYKRLKRDYKLVCSELDAIRLNGRPTVDDTRLRKTIADLTDDIIAGNPILR